MDAVEPDFAAVARQLGSLRRCRKGDVIFHEGDAADSMYLVLCGAVEIESGGHTIERLERGHALGTVSLIDNLARSATARAVQDSELVALDSRRFRYMIEQTPLFCWFIMRTLVQRLRAVQAAH